MWIMVFRAWRTTVALGVAGGVGLVAACSSEPHVSFVPDAYLAFESDGVVFGMTHRITQDGVLQGLVYADTAIQWQDSAAVHLRGSVDLTVMEEDGAQRAHVTADRGVLETRSNRMTANGNVVLTVAASSRRVETEELHYDPQGDRIWTDSAFVYTEGTRITRGNAFTSDLNFTDFRVVGRGGGGGAR